MNYNSDLKPWGAIGSPYPDNYSYNEGEQPVDEWDNYFAYSVIADIEHLIGATNNDLLLRNGGSLLSDLSVGDYGLTGTAGSIDFSGTEITVGGTVDILQSLDVGGNITISAGNTIDGVDLSALKTEFDSHAADTTNPHSVTNVQVGAPSNLDFNNHTGDNSAHHTRYVDSEAISAVNSENSLSVNISGTADKVDGYDIAKNGTDGLGTINFKTN